ncbi:MAG: glycosyltransferase [Mycobacteriales bacterium]
MASGDCGRRLKILQVLPTFDRDFGGPVRAASATAQAYSIFADVLTVGLDSDSSAAFGGATCVFPGHSLPFGPRFSRQFSPSLHRWLGAELRGFDVAHVHLNRGLVAPLAGLQALRRNVPLVVQTHGMCAPWAGVKATYDRLLTARVLSRAERTLVLSTAESDDLSRAFGARTEVMANAITGDIAPERSMPAAPPFRLLFSARLHPRKGLDFFIRVCAAIQGLGLPTAALVAGADQGSQAEAEALAGRLAVHVRFLGSLPYDELLSVMDESDVLLHTAPHEPFGMSMLEAFSRRLPVVAAASSALAPLFESSGAAILAKDFDVQHWAAAAVTLLIDPAAAKSQADRAVCLLEREYSVDHLAQRLRSMLSSILREP